jgi:MspA
VWLGRVAALTAAGALAAGAAAPAAADPDPGSRDLTFGPAQPAAASQPAAPIQDGPIAPAPPATSTAPDGWTLTVGARDEQLQTVNPLTTAVSSRSYEVSGVYVGLLNGPPGAEPPRGVLEVGYQIGCGIDMSTSQGVTLLGSAGLTPSIGLGGIAADSPLPEVLNPILLAPASSSVALGLKPGIINVIPVAKKEFRGVNPWISVSGFRVKIDGCVGESFIRSYAVLTHSTDQSDAIQGYYGTIKKV